MSITNLQAAPPATDLAALLVADPVLAPLAAVAGPLPDRRIAPGYAGLAWIICGQQISVAAGRAIHARCEAALGSITADAVARADDLMLRAAGLSAPKIRALRAASNAVLSGTLDFDDLATRQAEEAIASLVTIKGIGPWTAEVYLLFAVGHADVFPAGDLALQEAARIGFNLDVRPTVRVLRERAEIWRPYRGTAARLLWAYYGATRSGRDAAPV